MHSKFWSVWKNLWNRSQRDGIDVKDILGDNLHVLYRLRGNPLFLFPKSIVNENDDRYKYSSDLEAYAIAKEMYDIAEAHKPVYIYWVCGLYLCLKESPLSHKRKSLIIQTLNFW